MQDRETTVRFRKNVAATTLNCQLNSYLCPMTDETAEFVAALGRYVCQALAFSPEAPEYSHAAVEIVDARNHLFRAAGNRPTDETANIYALRDLCRTDEETLELRPDTGRLAAVARNCGVPSLTENPFRT